MSDVSDLNEHERDGIVELAVHPAMWDWLVDAIRGKGFDVSPPIATSNCDDGEPRGYFRVISIPPEKMHWAEKEYGQVAP